ncbi:MAG: ATP-binding protein [Chloroflexota bacterium]
MTFRRRHLTIRTRLALWYAGLLGGTLTVLILLGLWLVRHQLQVNADELLRSKAAAVATEVDVTTRGRIIFDTDGRREGQLPPVAVGLDFVRVMGPDGRVAYTYDPGFGVPEMDASSRSATQNGESVLSTVRSTDAGSLRLLTQPMIEKYKTIAIVQVGRSQADLDSLLAQMGGWGAAAVGVSLLLAWIGGYFLAGRALAPVDEIRKAAESLGAGELALRLSHDGADDELGRLVGAFNGFLQRMQAAFEQQRRFTSDASHELRTPLAVIRSLAEVALQRASRDGSQRATFASIRDECDRLGRLVESLLLLARSDESHTVPTERVECEELLAESMARAAPSASTAGVTLALEPRSPVWTRGDRELLIQLIMNLLENAIRHTAAGGRVDLACGSLNDHVVLSVSDTGSGIAPEHLARVFDRFYRVDSARDRSSGGFGLGLAICRWIARAHAGDISVRSAVGVGTTFDVLLPRVTPQTSPPPPSSRAAAAPEQPRPYATTV